MSPSADEGKGGRAGTGSWGPPGRRDPPAPIPTTATSPRASRKSPHQPARTPLDLSDDMAGPPVPADRRLIPTISLSQGSPPATLFPCCPLGKPDLTNPLQRHQKQRRDRICALVAAGGCAAVPSGRPLSLARAIIRAPAQLVGVDGTPARRPSSATQPRRAPRRGRSGRTCRAGRAGSRPTGCAHAPSRPAPTSSSATSLASSSRSSVTRNPPVVVPDDLAMITRKIQTRADFRMLIEQTGQAEGMRPLIP